MLVAVVLAVAVAGAACAARPQNPRPASTPAVVAAAFGGTDTAWTQLMIPMTAQAVALLELTATRASASRLAELATELRDGYQGDLRRLRAALTRAGLTPTHEHDGHDLPGMVTAADLEAIGRSGGASFDALAAEHLRGEMEQSVRLARSEQQAGQNRDCMAIASSIEKSRSASLGLLNAVIAR
jgi:uncharacterized protein (DUF305 family)